MSEFENQNNNKNNKLKAHQKLNNCVVQIEIDVSFYGYKPITTQIAGQVVDTALGLDKDNGLVVLFLHNDFQQFEDLSILVVVCGELENIMGSFVCYLHKLRRSA